VLDASVGFWQVSEEALLLQVAVADAELELADLFGCKTAEAGSRPLLEKLMTFRMSKRRRGSLA